MAWRDHPKRRRLPGMRAKAEDLRRRLTESEFREACQFTPEEVAVLDKLCTVAPPRNAQAILAALVFKAQYAYRKAPERQDHTGGVTIRVVREGGA